MAERFQFIEAVNRAEFGCLRDAKCGRFVVVNVGAGRDGLLDQCRREFSVRCEHALQRQTVREKPGRAAFVADHMTVRVADHATVGFTKSRE